MAGMVAEFDFLDQARVPPCLDNFCRLPIGDFRHTALEDLADVPALRLRVDRVERVRGRILDLGEDRIAEDIVVDQHGGIERRPRLHGLDFIARGVGDGGVVQADTDEPEPLGRRCSGRDVDLAGIHADVAPAITLIDAEFFRLVLGHLRQRIDEPGGVLERAGAASPAAAPRTPPGT